MFTDAMLEKHLDIITLCGVTAVGIQNLIDYAYSSRLNLDNGRLGKVCRNMIRHQRCLETVWW